MANYLVQGFLLGLVYLAPIGMQNLYVINTAAQGDGRRTLVVAAATIFFDISLALTCFFGVGLAIEASLHVRRMVLLAGSVAVTYIGISLIRGALHAQDSLEQAGLASAHGRTGADLAGKVSAASKASLGRLIASSFAVTWLNPQAVIDGSLLLGGHRASLPPGAPVYFILGVCLASASWFSFLSVSVAILRARISPAVVRAINGVCGAVLIVYGLRLGLALLR